MASSAVACGVFSLLGLILGSWYIQQATGENKSKCLGVLTMLCAFFSCMFEEILWWQLTLVCLVLFSCGVWSIMLTTNLHQEITPSIILSDLGFSFWINIVSSGLYLYTLLVYLLANGSADWTFVRCQLYFDLLFCMNKNESESEEKRKVKIDSLADRDSCFSFLVGPMCNNTRWT